MSLWSQLNFQESNSPLMHQMILFHDYLLILMLIISVMVFYKMNLTLVSLKFNFKFTEHHNLEVIWTSIPALVLLFILLPSMKILYQIEENNPLLSFKIMGHQWYWSYEILKNLEFDSYLSKSSLSYRLIDADNRVSLPYGYPIHAICSSADVIHSWTIPSLAVKTDAIPGRMNQMNFYLNRPGIFYGQCSEICGANHSFMPITLESISLKNFLKLLDVWAKYWSLKSKYGISL